MEKLLEFSRTLSAFARVERITWMPGTERKENDVEHSYHLAMMAWYLIESEGLDLDVSRVLKYALVHDLVEVHAGDTPVWSRNEEHHASKQEREAAAARQLQQEYPEFPELHTCIQEYEDLVNAESRFVYALDKLVPMILIQEDGGRSWKEEEVTLDMIREKKSSMIAVSPEVEPYFHMLLVVIEEAKVTAEY